VEEQQQQVELQAQAQRQLLEEALEETALV